MSIAFTRAWVLLSALLIAAGWILSALHALDRTGYAIALAVIALVLVASREGSPGRALRWTRFRRWLPLGFALVSVLAALGGLLHAPNNFDALAYRIPRTLHWVAEGHWHWIDTNYARLNVRSQGTEWMMAPLLLFTRTDRAVWLLNFLPFLALPGLIFSVFKRAGISPRVAWHWMWLLPCGYGVAGQAGGSANDLPGVFFALAAVHFGLKARETGDVRELWFSALAAAVLSATKLSNTPLCLVWLVAAWPALRLVRARPLASAAVAVLVALASFLPGVILNAKHCGDWTGATAELPQTKVPRPAGLVFATNTISLIGVNFAPPILPWAARWNSWAAERLPGPFLAAIHTVYGPHFAPTDLPEIHGEDWAGLGCGLSVLLAASAVLGRRRRPTAGPRWLRVAPWAALGVMLWMMPVTSIPRMALPYYPLLALAAMSHRRELLRRLWWRALAAVAVLTCAAELIITPSRPLWPASGVLARVKTTSPAIDRALTVYTTYAHRADALAPVRDLLPGGVTKFGLVTHNDLETSLWRPFGGRDFAHVIPGTKRNVIAGRGLDHLVVNASYAGGGWLAELGAETIGEVQVRTLASGGMERWLVVRLRSE
ncbi:MAG: hypothetical protein ABMA13_14175 [Chthoniobacteraceae bacterium]